MSLSNESEMLAGVKQPSDIAKGLSGTTVLSRFHSYWMTAGRPSAASAPASGVNGEALNAPVVGQIDFSNPASGITRGYELYLGGTTQSGEAMVADRLWQNSGLSVTSTSEQTISAVAIPARDANFTTAGTGVYAAMEIITATGAGTPTATLKYTNSAGVTGRTATTNINITASGIAGAFYDFALQSGDYGVRAIESLTLSATMTTGSISLVLFRPIKRMPIPLVTGNSSTWLDGFGSQLPDSMVLWPLFCPSTTTSTGLHGSFTYSQG